MDEDTAIVFLGVRLPTPLEAKGVGFERFLGAEVADGSAGGGEDTVFHFPCGSGGLFAFLSNKSPAIETFGEEIGFL